MRASLQHDEVGQSIVISVDSENDGIRSIALLLKATVAFMELLRARRTLSKTRNAEASEAVGRCSARLMSAEIAYIGAPNE